MVKLHPSELELGNADALRRLALSAAEQAVGEGLDPPALARFAELFVRGVLRGQGRPGLSPLPAPSGGDGPVPGCLRRAEAYLREHAQRPVPVGEVAAAAGCSVRALQHVFQRFRGTSPNAALRQVRLDRAREDLARGNEPVSAVARRWGYANAGRFAAAYASRFGEAPAETRQNRRPSPPALSGG